MNVKRILLLPSMCLAAIAFATPAVAQADVELTEEGEALKVGAKVTATSENLQTVTVVGTLQCELVTLHFEVKSNEAPHVVLDPLGEANTENCTFPLPSGGMAAVTFTDSTVLTPLTINTWGTGWAGATFISDTYDDLLESQLLATCHLQGVAHVEGEASGSNELEIGPALLAGTGAGCPVQATMAGDFTLETEDGTPVTLDFEETE